MISTKIVSIFIFINKKKIFFQMHIDFGQDIYCSKNFNTFFFYFGQENEHILHMGKIYTFHLFIFRNRV